MNRCVLSSLALAALTGVAQADIYTGGAAGAIPDAGATNVATPNPSGYGGVALTLGAANIPNPTISSFNAIAIAINHTWVGDLVIILTSPGGQTADILVRAGVGGAASPTFGNGDNLSAASGNAYVFVNTGGLAFPIVAGTSPIPTGTYNRLPALNGTIVATGATGNDFTIFNGGNVNGNWTLTVRDFGQGDTGNVVGWSMDITTVPTPGAAAMLGLGGLMVSRRRR